ncbi:PH domain-containing protein [Wenzhouxiangella sp. XN79A]|uniref:photosynthetic complex putative assembly protein PuhB n=1 Tax=Wenzhouxiangella sp. XN79A TaxID=2724193 RepID=UPI00144A571D|nr:photosynthetic complex putative assembly protein PuhB [Wenzhouxiangella sp. XN79A]NKI34865.1 PH domain-containing protein [Wenzhouxiangella sp. XN79A]
MSEIRVKPIKPLPEPLPAGERVLWQGTPDWRPYSRRVFQLAKFGVYFLAIVVWVAAAAYLDQRSLAAMARSLVWSLPTSLGVLGMIALTGWAYARSSVYTITTKRVVIEGGIALQTSVNLPFAKVTRADLKTFEDGTGDIELELSGPRLLYSMVWPNLRWLRINRPVPVMRAIEDPKRVAELLRNALAADQSTDIEAGQNAEAPPPPDAKPEIRRSAAS